MAMEMIQRYGPDNFLGQVHNLFKNCDVSLFMQQIM